jgi:hypothetical protein
VYGTCLQARSLGRRQADMPLLANRAQTSLPRTHPRRRHGWHGRGIRDGVCIFSPSYSFSETPRAGQGLVLYVLQGTAQQSWSQWPGSTARRRSGGLVPRWRSKQKWLPATSVRRQLPSAIATPELGLARADDGRPLAASQPFFVARAEACSRLLFRPPIFLPAFLFRPIQPHSSS